MLAMPATFLQKRHVNAIAIIRRVCFVVAVGFVLLATGCEPASTRTAPANKPQASAVTAEITTEKKESSKADSPNTAELKLPETHSPKPASDGSRLTVTGDLASVDWESMVGKELTIAGDLVVVDTYDLARRGRVVLARDRLFVPTSQFDPNDADPDAHSFEGGSNVAQVIAAQKRNDRATITIDDGSGDQNIFPPTLFPGFGKEYRTVRAGSIVHGVSGKLIKSRNKLFLVSDEPLSWTPAPRPQSPSVGNADVTIASFNVLNYFTTIDNGKNGARGADSDSEFTRQEAKTVSAIIALQADVVGLMEIENNLEAEQKLVAALNESVGKDVFKGCGLPIGFAESPGGENTIRVGIIYRSDRVAPVGRVSMIDDPAFFVARTPVVQTFKAIGGGKPFTVIVNHFKSKGASKADEANKNKGDGQGAYNAARRNQALAVSSYIQRMNPNDARVLVIGDLNAYDQEDPIDALRAKGLVDLNERYASDSSARHYSYSYYGQSGSLDHAFATESLARDVTGIATWHINSDEPRFLDYNQEYNPEGLYEPNPFRSSDHDPLLIGIKR